MGLSFHRSLKRRPHAVQTGAVVSVVVAVAALTGCASAASAPIDAPTETRASVVDNCGTDVAITADAPERIVTIKSTSTELLLALGLGERIVGSAFQDGPVPDAWADASSEIPIISDFAPGQEAVLELEPDFVFAGWESMFTAEAAGERESLQALGIGSYVAPSACKDPAYKPEKLSFDEVFDEILEAGSVFHADDAATELVSEQRDALEEIPTDDRGLTALWYSSGTDIPYVGAGIGAPQMMMERLGLGNVAGDVDDTWSSLGWEAIVDADPDVIVLVDASWNSADSKIEILRANPATAALDAVRESRYLIVPFAAGEAGVRNVSATADLADQLAALELD
ncbi:MAG TPA: putative F420-0 ABC transporter substrate-binding protein [Leifsonia sp.]|jgi:iron complex transport system substrate-binding protein|nr:corrinoid transporter substrate-binding protein [Microbacteriaceae bacterium]HEV7813029.1 putative F420-0 ABC transporter substrate-binding protein [Leifsonia sp.]